MDAAREIVTEVHLEDIPVCQGIQAGIQSRRWTPGPLSVQEATPQRFHRLLADGLTDPEEPA